MYIVAIAWIYVVLMMSITEQSVTAGLMTFLLYGVFPLSFILYVLDTPQRKRRRANAEKLEQESALSSETAEKSSDSKKIDDTKA
jgi:hypothetical protein